MARGTGPNAGSSTTCTATSPATSATHHTAAPTRHQGDQMDAELRRLIDRQEIADLCVRYTFALDTKDWALFESCFTAAAAFVHPGGRLEGVEAILARSRGALKPLDASQHLRAGAPGGETYIIAGRYTDTLARTPDGWKIAERVQVYLWRDGNRAVVKR